MKRFFLVLVAALLSLLSVGPVLAQSEGEAPAEAEQASSVTSISAYAVDASEANVSIALVSNYFDVDAAAVTVVENEVGRNVLGIKRASDAGAALEMMLVVDTRQAMASGNALDLMKAELSRAVSQLPPGTRVGLVEAGESAIVAQELTSDLDLVLKAIGGITLSGGGAVVDGVARSVAQFDRRPVSVTDRSLTAEPVRSIVVISGGEDTWSSASRAAINRDAVRNGAQVFSVRYQGGEAFLSDLIESSSGLTYNSSSVDDLAVAIEDSFLAATDRLLITYEGIGDQSVRSDVSVSVGQASTSLSFSNGRFTGVPTALAAVPKADLTGPGFLQTSVGLYLSLLLAFVAVALVIYSFGSLFMAGDVTLEAMLDRYATEGDSADMTAEETSIVQTALVQRAVEMSESFAEDRGFLLKIETLLEQANISLRPGEAMSFLVAGMVLGGFAGVFLKGLFGGFVLALVTGLILFNYVRFVGKRRQKKFEKQLPDMLTLLAGTLRAGYSLPQGLEAVSHEIGDPMGHEIRRAMTETRLGREIEESLETVADRMHSPDFAWAVMAISIQREVGGNLNELLMTVAETMIARERLKGEVAALTAEGKMTAILLGGLPPGLGFVMWIMNPQYIEGLFNNTLGLIMLGGGIFSMVIGMIWMRKVMTIDV